MLELNKYKEKSLDQNKKDKNDFSKIYAELSWLAIQNVNYYVANQLVSTLKMMNIKNKET